MKRRTGENEKKRASQVNRSERRRTYKTEHRGRNKTVLMHVAFKPTNRAYSGYVRFGSDRETAQGGGDGEGNGGGRPARDRRPPRRVQSVIVE